MNLRVFSAPGYYNFCSLCWLSVSECNGRTKKTEEWDELNEWIGRGGRASLASERLEGFYSYTAFKSLSIIGRFPVNMNIPAAKTGAVLLGPHPQNAGFLENCSSDFD